MDSDFRAFLEMPEPGVKRTKRRRGYNAFGWAVFLLLLAGGVMASWIGSIYVFNHPEDPDCYHFLKQMNKIEPIKRFDLNAAPPGKFFTARELFDNFLVMTPAELDAKNDEFLRDYLRNYAQVKEPVSYLCGRFNTTGVYELSKSDMFPAGMVAVADSVDFPQVSIEHIYPTTFANVPRARQMLAIDPEIRLDKSFSLAAIVHVTKLPDDRMLFTVIPIDYGQYAYKQGISSTFRLDPPQGMNLEAGFPVVKPDVMDKCEKTFALYRKNRGLLAKENMITLPSAAAAPQPGELDESRDLPPEALLPYHPADAAGTAPAVSDDASGSAIAAAAPPVTTPPDELPQVTAPSSAGPETAAPPSVTASTAPPAPALSGQPVPSRAPAVVKQDKTAVKTSPSALPSPAPAVRQIARVQPAPSPAAATATAHPAISKPKTSAFASVTQPAARPAATPAPSSAVERAIPYPSPAPVEYSEAVPAETNSSGVKLEPFLPPPVQIPLPAQQTTTTVSTRTATWPTYSPGMMPRGRLITMDEAPQLADLGIGNNRLYIDGRFVVTASSDGRAVLRPVNYNGAISGATIRMVVEYPNGARVPMEGAQVARGTLRPFQVIDVRRGDDGQVNIYAREVTVPMNQASSNSTYRYRLVQQGNGFD